MIFLLILYAQIMLIGYSVFYSPEMDKVLVFFPSISIVILLIAAFLNDIILYWFEKIIVRVYLNRRKK